MKQGGARFERRPRSEEEEQLLEILVSSLMNLEQRMEIRLGTLQDTFNSLIGRLIDSQQNLSRASSGRLRGKKSEDDDPICSHNW